MRYTSFTGAANNWWLRSPEATGSTNFANVNNNGNSNSNNASNANGVSWGSSPGRHSNRKAKSDLGGEKERMTFRKVNIHSDRPGRTLLAWLRLMVNPQLHAQWSYAAIATISQRYRVRGFVMTSEERKEARYQRRRARRLEKKRAAIAAADNYERTFCYKNLYQAYRKCRKGVAWKSSVQRYIATAPLSVYHTYQRLQNGSYRSPGFFEFDLYERGKHRHIRSTVIGERVVQRCLCDNALVPILERSLIYDNGASMKDKGYSFAVRRMVQHLREHYRKHGNNGYILLFDFRKFFDNVSHQLVKRILRNQFTDERLLRIIEHFVDAFGDVGLGLGSQISQVLALASASDLDHLIKDKFSIRGNARYMDDGYIIHTDKDYLRRILGAIQDICTELEIVLNVKKTQIVKLSHGFTWLKIRVFLTSTGKVVRKIYKRSVTKQRKKLKKLHKRYRLGLVTKEDIYQNWQSWCSYARNFNAYFTIKNMERLFNQLFVFPEEGDYALYQSSCC